MSFIWPKRLNPKPGVSTYVGRGLHWMGVAVAITASLFGLYEILASFELMFAHKPTGAALTLGLGLFSCAASVVIFFVSRAVRHVFSRE